MERWSCAACQANALAFPAMTSRSPQVREIAATPAQLRALAVRQSRLFPALFDSTALGPLGRYSILAAAPCASLILRGDGRLECQGVSLHRPDFLGALDEWWHAQRSAPSPDAGRLPFRGGWVVYLAYETADRIESGLHLPALAADAVCAMAIRVPAALIYDHERSRCHLMHEPDAAEAGARIERALAARPAVDAERLITGLTAGAVLEQDPEAFRSAVLRAQEHISLGDIYQANLSRGWQVQLPAGADPGALYESLRRANPAPFAVYATLPAMTLLSSSPERLVRVASGIVETRPIAGTRARHGTLASDDTERQELLANAKERAEHVMLIDLERNDLGRICTAGSVEVNEFMVTESYPHLHHIVSNVRGQLREGVTPGTTLRAVFPGGTITGCPKYRCMQLIGELEGEARGAYTGSVGYLNTDGDMDFNILIRTATLSGSELRFRTGAGIVADSDWSRELAETRIKAQGLLRAFGSRP
ncbi:MAG TPA: aminodeoxychorismate synthase component I [Steroidobacteraceae bacterium]|nr:aminodeoxychorismate synthase component I [Steroidobacteraceae bacterium]